MNSSQKPSTLSKPDTLKPEQTDVLSAAEHGQPNLENHLNLDNHINPENQNHWVIAGIKHEIFMRVFPSLRHGLVGPISIARMSISIVRRLLARGDASLTSLNEPVERIDQQLAEAVLGIRNLQNWEPGSKPQTQQLVEIISEGMALMTAPLAMREIVLDYVTDASAAEQSVSNPSALLYTWLGVLCYFQDSLQQACTLNIVLQAQSLTVRHDVSATSTARASGRAAASAKVTARAIDKDALVALASAGNFALSLQPDGLELSWD